MFLKHLPRFPNSTPTLSLNLLFFGHSIFQVLHTPNFHLRTLAFAIPLSSSIFWWYISLCNPHFSALSFDVTLWVVFPGYPFLQLNTYVILCFPGGAGGKEPTCQCRRHKKHEFNPWVRKIPWRKAWHPTLVFLPGESHGQRSLVG